MKKLFILAIIMIAVLVGCTAQPIEETPTQPVVETPIVEVDPSIVSFEALGESIVWTTEADKFTIVAPDQSVTLSIAQSFTADQDVIMSVDATPFINAGLDVSKLPVGLFVDGRLNYVTLLEGSNVYTNVNEAFADIVSLNPELVGYHAALDHYGLSLQDGNVFEWASDVNTNDKDIVFVLNPQTLIDAGANVEAVEGWLFAEVEIMQADGSMKMVAKLLKPFELN